MVKVPEVVLTSGSSRPMPLIGIGTATYPFATSVAMKTAIIDAMEMGYRHFDTATLYQSEHTVGEAIAEAMRLGIISSRDELFITSKLWCSDAHPDLILPAIRETLQNLQVGYLDLYLIHWTVRVKKTGEKTLDFPKHMLDFPKHMLLPIDIKSTWEAMEECQRLGLTKSIGVSNFSCKKLIDLLATTKIPPAVNQVEMHPYWQQKKLRELCAKKGVHVSAWSPLGGKGNPWGTNSVMDSEVLKMIAQARGTTVAQVALRWVFEQGVSLLVKSFNRERLKENLGIFDWELSEEDRNKISVLPQQGGFAADLFVSADGQYKSIDQLWDGEI